MPLSRGAKIGIGAGVLLLLGVGAAGAKGLEVIPAEPAEPKEPEVPPEDEIDPPEGPPPPPPGPACDYLGCPGFVPTSKWTEVRAGLELQQLGYAINPAAANYSIVSDYSRSVVRQFQRDFNRVRKGLAQPPPALQDDGLVGNRTISAIVTADQIVLQRIQSWKTIVGLSPP